MTTLQTAAIAHLRLLQSEQIPSQDALYVHLAFAYGVTVDAIAESSGLSLTTVRTILGGS